jgi:predicted permease
MKRVLPTATQQHGVLGDLEEEHARRTARAGRLRSNLWYWSQAALIYFKYRVESGKRAQGPRRFAAAALLHDLISDMRFAARTLRRQPVFSAVTIVTLGLGIGAITSVFSVVDAMLDKRLPYADPSRLVTVWLYSPDDHAPQEEGELVVDSRRSPHLTFPQYRAINEAHNVFESVAAFGAGSMVLTDVAEPARVSVGVATSTLFSVLGRQPVLGRTFLPAEEGSVAGEAANVVILSFETWRTRLMSDPEIVGRQITLDGRVHTIVGVLPDDFRIRSAAEARTDTGERDLWVPIGQPGYRLGGIGASARDWEVIARLKEHVSIRQAITAAETVMNASLGEIGSRVQLVTRRDDEGLALDSRTAMLVMIVALFLFITCSNVATLSLGDLLRRRAELTTRVALGAGVGRLVRQLLTESAMLGLLGSALGIALAYAGTQALISLGPPIPRLDELTLDLRVLFFAVAVGLAAGLTAGILPALVSTRSTNTTPTLSAASRRTTDRREGIIQSAVLFFEIAITVVLLVSGGLFLRSLQRMLAVDEGFESQRVATARVLLPDSPAPAPDKMTRFSQAVLRELEASPLVASASAVGGLPFGGGIIGADGLRIVGSESEGFSARRLHVLPGFLETMRIPLIAGRTFAESDGPGAPPVMIVTESLARQYFNGVSPVGRQVSHWGERRTVVGVVGDVHLERLDTGIQPTFLVPLTQIPRSEVNFVVRANGLMSPVFGVLRNAIRTVDGNLPITQLASMSDLLLDSVKAERFRTFLVLAFGTVAAVLAATGIFGVTARGVAQCTREMGIRSALGAQHQHLLLTILRGKLSVATLGTLAGLAAAFLFARLLSHFLFGIETWDIPTYSAVGSLVVLTSIVSGYLPARRILRVDPADALRAE